MNRLSSCLTFLSLGVTSISSAQQSKTQVQPSVNTQQVLDILASPAKFTNTTPPLPDHYVDWTEDQRRVGKRQITGRCNVLWVMMNDAGPPKLLPPTEDPADSARLASEVCLAAHMPLDWPQRSATIADIKRILARSTELGWPLTLPEILAR